MRVLRTGLLSFMAMALFAPEGEGGGGAPPAGGEAAPAAPAVPWGNADGSFTIGDKPWTEALPQGPTRELMTTKAYKNPHQLADAYFSLNKLVSGVPGGVDALQKGDISAFVPKDDAPAEQREAFYKALGRPDNADAYTLTFPDGVQADEDMVKFGRDLAFELGLNPTQAQKMADKWNEFAGNVGAQSADAARVANEAEVNALREKWGGENVLAANVEAGKRTVQSLQLDADTLVKIEGAMGGAAMLDLFARLGSMSGEKPMQGGTPGAGNTSVDALTPDQARDRISSLQGDTAFMAKYTSKDHPDHAAALREMEALFKRAG